MDTRITAPKGAVLLGGLEDWQILQQENGAALVTLHGEYHAKRLASDPPVTFSDTENPRGVTVKARVVLENTAGEVVPWTECALSDGQWAVTLKVPAGGLYRLELTMTYGGADGYTVTRGDMVRHWGVGDVFVIAGQSNAAGRAKDEFPDPPVLGVNLLRNSGVWDIAAHPMNDCTGAVYEGHYENHNPGHGPFLAFAKRLRAELGYPIGLIMTAYGGSPLRWWNPEENGALLGEAVRMVKTHSPKVKAMLWYQGEADGMEETGDTYLSRFAAFVGAARAELGAPKLPVFTLQLARCTYTTTDGLDKHWGLVRDAQVKAAKTLSGVYVVPTLDLELYDSAHLSTAGNIKLGERVAVSALSELYGIRAAWQAHELLRAEAQEDGSVLLKFSHCAQWLDPFGVPPEALPFSLEGGMGLYKRPVSWKTKEDGEILLTFATPVKPGMKLHGAWEMNPPAYIPCNENRLPFLAFYGREIT
ncbi:MAG: sialate O-acetylesterase [Oscillospiraceae bacterium]|jgi:hypothetical protein|nr:sialate O-acetylesterase [Oscillospiraceae bacterium]